MELILLDEVGTGLVLVTGTKTELKRLINYLLLVNIPNISKILNTVDFECLLLRSNEEVIAVKEYMNLFNGEENGTEDHE